MNLYPFARGLAKALFCVFFRPRVVMGQEHLNPDETVIYCANHRHFYDPFLIAVHVKKQIHFMAKKELFENKILGWIMTHLGAFPVDRGRADVASIKRAVTALEEDKIVGIFPEGTRSHDDAMGQIHAGAVWIALKSGKAIVPAYIDSRGLFKQTRIFVGEKIDFTLGEGERINAATRDVAAQKLSDAMLDLEKTAEEWSKN